MKGHTHTHTKPFSARLVDTASVADPFAHGEATVGVGDEDGSVSWGERVLEFLGICN